MSKLRNVFAAAVCMVLLAVSMATAAEFEAKIGTNEYATLEEAVAGAKSGETITLLKDVTLDKFDDNSDKTGVHRHVLFINKSLTLDGNGKTITATQYRGIGVGGAEGKIDVTFKNLCILNNTNEGKCIETRGNIGTLTIDNTQLYTRGTSGYMQPLTIGGSQKDAAIVKITESEIESLKY